MTQLLVTSLYEDSGTGTLRLVEHIDLQKEPWFWPPVVEISCKQKKYPEVYPPWGGQHLRFPVQPKTPPSRWVNVVDQTEDGRTILVGRIPVWDEFWSGAPPERLRTEIAHSEVDAFLGSLMQGAKSSSRTFFEQKQAQLQSQLPPKTMFGYNFPVGPIASGPTGPNPRDAFDPRPVDQTRPGNSSNCWERICCIGLDVEKREVTAIVEVTQTAGYGGNLCSSSAFESVGFWLIEPSRAELVPNEWQQNPNPNPNSTRAGDPCGGQVRFIGAKRIPVADIPRNEKGNAECLNPLFQYDAGSLRYSVSLPLTDDDLDLMKKCNDASPRLPVLHAVVAWNVDVKNENFGGRGLRFGDWDSEVVQYSVPTVRKLTREIAIGLLSDECPYVRYSNVVWPKEVKGIEWTKTGERFDFPPVQLERMAIDVTAKIKAKIQSHGSMRIFVVNADYESKLLRRRIIARQDINRQTPVIQLTEIPSNSVVTPFDLVVGDWIICASFGQSNEVISWDPERDLVLSGFGESLTTTCIGLFTDLRKPGIKMAGPFISSSVRHVYRKSVNEVDKDFSGLPCIEFNDDRVNLVSPDAGINQNVRVYYPVNNEALNVPKNLNLNPDGSVVVVAICAATGTRSQIDPDNRDGKWYIEIIEQFVLMGAAVLITEVSIQAGPFFLRDVLPLYDAMLSDTFKSATSFRYILFGHSSGGNQVRCALSSEEYSDAAEANSVGRRIAGGIMLTPAFLKEAYVMVRAPILIVAGGLDSQTGFLRLGCRGADSVYTNKYSPFFYSWITAWEMSRAAHSYLLFAPGATHFRWLRGSSLIPDFEDYRTSDEPLEQNLILDGPLGLVYQPKYAQRHQALLLSYVSYFYQAHALDKVNYLQMLMPGLNVPPDLERFNPIDGKNGKLIRGYSLYSKPVTTSSINSLKNGDSTSWYRGAKVVRTIEIDRMSVESVSIKPAYDVIALKAVAGFAQDLVVLDGTSFTMNFSFPNGLVVSPTSVLSIQYLITDFAGNGDEQTPDVRISLEFDDLKLLQIPVKRRARYSPNYRVSEYNHDRSTISQVFQGDTIMLKQVSIPISWFLQTCLGESRGELSVITRKLVVEIKSSTGKRIKFGIGRIQCGRN